MIRKMRIEDAGAVAEIDSLCFSVPWKKEQYEAELMENDFARLYVLEQEGNILGFIDFWITFDSCQLAKIAVMPAYQGNHLACRLMDKMIEEADKAHCETISLEVRVSNEKAHRLYEAYDFIKVNVRKQYYQDNGEDADFLIKALGGNCL